MPPCSEDGGGTQASRLNHKPKQELEGSTTGLSSSCWRGHYPPTGVAVVVEHVVARSKAPLLSSHTARNGTVIQGK